jgi:phage-related minor tail protein
MSKEQRATSQAIASSLDQVKQEALQLRSQIVEELVMVEDRCDLSALDQVNGFQSDCFLNFPYQAEKETLARRMREMLHQCYKFGFEVLEAQGVMQFSMQWMR